MNIRGIIWLRNVVDKLAWKHNVTTEEVEGVFNHKPHYRFIENGDVEGKIFMPHSVEPKQAVT